MKPTPKKGLVVVATHDFTVDKTEIRAGDVMRLLEGTLQVVVDARSDRGAIVIPTEHIDKVRLERRN